MHYCFFDPGDTLYFLFCFYCYRVSGLCALHAFNSFGMYLGKLIDVILNRAKVVKVTFVFY